jgi:hypothetical protein
MYIVLANRRLYIPRLLFPVLTQAQSLSDFAAFLIMRAVFSTVKLASVQLPLSTTSRMAGKKASS